MKRTILFLLLTVCIGSRMAFAADADTLVLRNQSLIRCTITEMTESAVSYTRPDRPKTMVFSTPLEQIVRILFSDGTVAEIAPAAKAEEQPQPITQTVVQTTPQQPAATAVAQQKEAEPQRNTTATEQQKTVTSGQGRIYRDNNQYLFDDKYISEKEVERVLRTNYAAYDEWQKSKRLLTAGWVMVGFTGAGLIGALACIPAGPAAVGGVCGGTLVFASVGLGVCIGSAKHKTKAIDIYNGQIDLAAELHFFTSSEGVGVALRF